MAGIWAGFRGLVARDQGRVSDAEVALREAVTLIGEHDEYQVLRVCLAALAACAALRSDTTAAATWLGRADGRQRDANRLYDAWVERDRAWVAAAAGKLSDGVRLAERAAALARDSEQPAFEAVALYDVARLGYPAQVLPRLRELAATLEGALPAMLAGAAAGLTADDGVTLEHAASDFAGLGQSLLAAEAAAAAARAYDRCGLANRCRDARVHAATLRAACPGARTPLLDLGGVGPALSPREREVALLAVRLPSRQIADRLGLTVNTVNNTLARAYIKLGVASRRELATVLDANAGR
jgi:DNA-binding CsgD family transcriptional regulator